MSGLIPYATATNPPIYTYYGQTTDIEQCEKWCRDDADCLAYILHHSNAGDYVNMCYGRDGSNNLEHKYATTNEYQSGLFIGCKGNV